MRTFAILTTAANPTMRQLHERMPVILEARDYDRWLDRRPNEQLPVDLLRPYAAEEMAMRLCNPKVGNVRNNGPEMMEGPA